MARFLAAEGVGEWKHGENPNKGKPGKKSEERATERAQKAADAEEAKAAAAAAPKPRSKSPAPKPRSPRRRLKLPPRPSRKPRRKPSPPPKLEDERLPPSPAVGRVET